MSACRGMHAGIILSLVIMLAAPQPILSFSLLPVNPGALAVGRGGSGRFSTSMAPQLAAGAAGRRMRGLVGGSTRLRASLDPDDMLKKLGDKIGGDQASDQMEEESQWSLFRTLQSGKWSGMWLTYDAMGTQVDDVRVDTTYTEFGADGQPISDEEEEANMVRHEQTIWVGQTSSGCERCTDTADLRVMPLGQYQKGNIGKHVMIGPGIVNGPRVLRNGAMITELMVRYGKGRVRATVQHAPVRLEGTPEDAPPDGLKVFRVVVAREVIAEFPPTPGSEKSDPPGDGQPVFWRGVSPFKWHAVWGGNSWTYGAEQGHLLWEVPSVEEADAWHGRPRGDDKNTWTLKLAGGVLLQCPTLITADSPGTFRMAWLPEDTIMRRVEAKVSALKPLMEDEAGTVMLAPPQLLFGRVDALDRRGDLAEAPTLVDAEPEKGFEGEGGLSQQ